MGGLSFVPLYFLISYSLETIYIDDFFFINSIKSRAFPFLYRMEYMLKVGKEKGYNLISFMGP